MKILFGREYVLKGLATEAEGKLLSQMETMRERADYDVAFSATEQMILERLKPVEQMIAHIKEIIGRKQ